MTQAISTIIPSRVLWAAWLISVPVNRKQNSHFFIPLKDKQQHKVSLIYKGQQNTVCTSERLREQSACSWQAVGSEMMLCLIAHHKLPLHREPYRGTTRTMATVPVKEAELGLRCLLQSDHLDPTQTTHGTDRRAQTHLRKDSEENVCQHLCVPGFLPHGSKPAQRIITAAVVDVMHLWYLYPPFWEKVRNSQSPSAQSWSYARGHLTSL